MINCCKDCVPPKRHTACWGTCPEYIAEKEAEAQRKADEKKANLAKRYRGDMMIEHYNFIVTQTKNSHGYSYKKKRRK